MGTLVEYGLILGFSILSFIIIIGIITSILEWTSASLSDFFNIFQIMLCINIT